MRPFGWIVPLALGAVLATPAGAQVEVPPGEGQEAFVAFLAERVGEIDVEDQLPPENETAAARVAVEGISGRLEGMGVEAVVAMAPKHEAVDVPRSGVALLDAIADYQLCMLPLDAETRDETPRENAFQERVGSLFMSATVYLVSSYLRTAYLGSGVTDEEAAGFFQGDPMTALGAEVEADPELRAGVLSACGPPLTELWQGG